MLFIEMVQCYRKSNGTARDTEPFREPVRMGMREIEVGEGKGGERNGGMHEP